MWVREPVLIHSVSLGEEIEVWGAQSNQLSTVQTYCAWFKRFDRPIAMLQYSVYPRDYAVVNNIEVRVLNRGYGLGRWLMSEVRDHVLNVPLYSQGFFTPEGERSLRGHLPMIPDQAPGVHYRSMNFVKNWDDQEVAVASREVFSLAVRPR